MHRNPNLQEFFFEAIAQAMAAQGIELSALSSHYLTCLLASRGERLPQTVDTLAELHLNAAQAPRREAIRLYRSLGDHALYTGGFFPESLQHKPVGLEYYRSMGGAAYGQVANLGGAKDPFSQMFEELARRFQDCVLLLSDVANAAKVASTADLMALYEEWLKTRSRHAERRLAELGMIQTTADPLAT
ncbi:MAG: hypothetical protein ACI9VR_001031 [Cognaticolwellia sp.]|jgi:hypothetical protein